MIQIKSKTHILVKDHSLSSGLPEHIRKIVNLYSCLYIVENNWLPAREKVFFIITVMNFILGYKKPQSEFALSSYQKYFNNTTSKHTIINYLNKLSKRGWLKYDKNEKVVSIPKFFENIQVESSMIDFELRLVFDETV